MTEVTRQQAIRAYEAAYSASDFEVVQARYRKKMLVALLERLKPKRLLEVGCGWDAIAHHWAGYAHCSIVEPGAQFAQQARSALQHDAKVTVIEAFLEEAHAALAGQSFDVILLSGLLHEVPDPLSILKQVKAYCHANTLIHVNVPNAQSMHRLLALEMGLISDVKQASDLQRSLGQPRIFDAQQLKDLAAAADLQVVEAGSYFIKPFTHQQMQHLIEQGLLTEAMLDGLWGLARHFPEAGSEIFVNLSL